MSEERRQVLQMLEAGTITPQDAQRLLEALGEETSLPEREACEEAETALARAEQEPCLAEPREAEQKPWGNAGEYDCAIQGETVERLTIGWANGSVEVDRWDGDYIHVAEYAKYPLKEGQQLELIQQGDTLKIEWTKSKAFWNKVGLSKQLVVKLPRELALQRLKVETASSSVHVEEICGDHVSLNAVSGRISARGLTWETLELGTTSGGIVAQGITGKSLTLSSTSGGQQVENCRVETLSMGSTSGAVEALDITTGLGEIGVTSGRVRFWGQVERLQVSSVSGNVDLRLGDCVEQVDANSVSGRIDVALPEELGFTVTHDAVSGRFHSDFPLTGEGPGEGTYGDGRTQINLQTVSGRMDLRKAPRA